MGKLLKKPKLVIFLLTIVVISTMVFPFGHNAISGNDDRIVGPLTGVRLSHPSVVIGNHHYSLNNPFNYNEDRVFMFEPTSTDNYPPGQAIGRGFVWGYISDLRAGFRTLDEYQAKARVVPKYNGKSWDGYSLLWSPFSDENNIVYGLARNLKSVIKMNVDTGVGEELIANYDVDNAIDYGNYVDPYIIGWTLDNNLVVGSDYSESPWGSNFEFDVTTKEIIYYSNFPGWGTELNRRFPTIGHGHGGKNKSQTYRAIEYGQSTLNYVMDLNTGETYEDCSWEKDAIQPTASDDKGQYTNHASWAGSDDWMIVSADRNYPKKLSPGIIDYYFYQVYPEYVSTEPCNSGGNIFEYKLLLTLKAPRSWCLTDACEGSDSVYLYSDPPHCVVAPSGNKMYCSYTDNQYAYRDYVKGGESYSDFGLPSGWVYDLNSETASINPADFDFDGQIDVVDLNFFKNLWGQTGKADLNQDDITNTSDLAIIMSTWGNY